MLRSAGREADRRAERPPTMTGVRRAPRLTIGGLRRVILAVLVVSVSVFTAGVFTLVQRIFDNFGPAVQKDLEWKALHGAQELARATDLGLAVSDPALVSQAFADCGTSDDVAAIVAINGDGAVVATMGRAPEEQGVLFSGSPGRVRSTAAHLVSWAGAFVEGRPVGKVAIVVSKRRLIESRSFLRKIAVGTAVSGLLALAFGLLFVNFFTRSILQRDEQLATYASGLEKKVAERTAALDGMNRDLHLVLDNVGQGFLTIALDGTMSTERSQIVSQWFGDPVPGATFAEYIGGVDPAASDWLAISLSALAEDLLPRDMLIDQLPRRMTAGARTFGLAYTPILSADKTAIARLLVVITDVTDGLAREKTEQSSREITRLFQCAIHDRSGTEQFFAEGDELVAQSAVAATAEIESRLIHTLKGNCALYGLESMVELCHAIETRLTDEGGRVTDGEHQRIASQWQRLSVMRGLMGVRRATIELETDDLRQLLTAIEAGAPREALLEIARGFQHESVTLQLDRLAEKARYVAAKLGKPAVMVQTDGAGLRLEATRWSPFWSAMVHAINNAVDHGIEPRDVRVAQDKPPEGRLWLMARREAAELVITLRDDGRGVDWSQLAARAAAAGLPSTSPTDLVEAMFTDGLSSKGDVTTTSGRGIGLAALRETTRALGGSVEVQSEPGVGTTFLFRFPDLAHAPDHSGDLRVALSAEVLPRLPAGGL